MQKGMKTIRDDAVGCVDLGELGLLDAVDCCETCHSADGYSHGRTTGPCRVALPDGGEAFVCCSGKRRLQSRYNPEQGVSQAMPDEREVVGA